MLPTKPRQVPQPTTPVADAYDVVVIGGGPAGATLATLVAEQGHSVLILERAIIPRFHVGESLIPETYFTLERLGLLEELSKTAFPLKHSVQFVAESGNISAPFYFVDYKQHPSSITWQVLRSEFDQMLVDNAVTRGAVLRTGSPVREVLFEGDRAVGVRAEIDGIERKIGATVVADASGQTAFLANRLGLKKADPHLKKGAIWSYFRGALRDEGRDEGATLILQTAGKKSWFWWIPLPDNIVSVGCTGDMDYLFGQGKRTPEEIFKTECERCPELARRLAPAQWPDEFLTTRDFSYRTTRSAGDGWVLVGDAGGFIDPVYSSGVFLALKSGEMAADAINDAFHQNDFTEKTLASWRDTYLAGVDNFRQLVYAFYTPEFSFADFLRKHPQYRSNLVDILIGDVFKPGVSDMFAAMEGVLPATGKPTPATEKA